jgi:uncharacterized protein YidB (DUF937 family)
VAAEIPEERDMGLLDDVLGNVMGAAAGGQQPRRPGGDLLGSILGGLAGGGQAQPAGGQAALLAAVFALVQQHGGLAGVLELFRRSGLGEHADSWVGTGPNKGVTPDQLQNVFGPQVLGQLAGQLGMSHGDASSAIAQVLPELINQFSPQGQLPDNHADLLSQGLEMLRGLR